MEKWCRRPWLQGYLVGMLPACSFTAIRLPCHCHAASFLSCCPISITLRGYNLIAFMLSRGGLAVFLLPNCVIAIMMPVVAVLLPHCCQVGPEAFVYDILHCCGLENSSCHQMLGQCCGSSGKKRVSLKKERVSKPESFRVASLSGNCVIVI